MKKSLFVIAIVIGMMSCEKSEQVETKCYQCEQRVLRGGSVVVKDTVNYNGLTDENMLRLLDTKSTDSTFIKCWEVSR